MNILLSVWRWLLQASAIQLFLTLISLPILTAWGLPLSYLTPFGTLLFTPVLTIYLCCALAVFITTLCTLPNSYCIYALQCVSSAWLWTLSLIKTPWQIGFVCPSFYVLALIPCSALMLVFVLRKKQLFTIVAALAILLTTWIFILRTLPTVACLQIADAKNNDFSVFYTNNQTTVIDTMSGCSSVVDGCSLILHKIMPEITKKTGAAHIDRFIIMHPRQRTFEALAALCKKGVIHDVYMPCWEGKLSWPAWCAYAEMRDTLKAYGYKIHYLKPAMPIAIDAEHQLVATETVKKYGEATYQLFEVVESTDNIKYDL